MSRIQFVRAMTYWRDNYDDRGQEKYPNQRERYVRMRTGGNTSEQSKRQSPKRYKDDDFESDSSPDRLRKRRNERRRSPSESRSPDNRNPKNKHAHKALPLSVQAVIEKIDKFLSTQTEKESLTKLLNLQFEFVGDDKLMCKRKDFIERIQGLGKEGLQINS